MPKAAPTASATNRPALRRNQACRPCRKRKLKCDAARPHCSTCVKQWQSLISVPAPPDYAHPAEPQCIYDPVEGLTLAPDTNPLEKIRLLEEEVSRLKMQLQEQRNTGLSESSQQPLRRVSHLRPESASSSFTSGSQATSSVQTPSLPYQKDRILPGHLHDSDPRDNSNSPELYEVGHKSSTDTILDIIYSGWNPDLPERNVLEHYIDVFFKCDPCGPRILHRPSFLAAVRLDPRDSSFPHSAILHAICASASRWSSRNVATLPDGTRRDEFAEFHASKTRQYIDNTMATGRDIFPVVQACILLAWYFYQEGRWVEIWIFAGFQTRVAIPLRLNYPGTFSTHNTISPGGYLPPPKDLRDLESRRRTWWTTIIFDRIVSVGGWIHAIDERDIGTELPLRGEDFDSEQLMPSNPQDMCTEDVFTTHLPKYTDSFLLLIKAIMMFGRVTDFNVRGNLRAPTAPSKFQDPFQLPGFVDLDRLVYSDFLENLPSMFKMTSANELPGSHSSVDTDLYMVHIIPHAATITLHNPYLDITDLNRISTSRCINAARAILSAYYKLSETSLDISRLHPFVTICWYLAAVVQVQVCKYFIEVGDEAREDQVWGEINVLRQAMINYGARSPIGTRQEKLLQGLMREIVRLTSQKQPLEVGLPLYPFSHTTLFATPTLPENAQMAPLPNPSTSRSMEYDSPTFVEDSGSLDLYCRGTGNAPPLPSNWGPHEPLPPENGLVRWS
ncbi:uncharacterized protein EDB91DRAFT_278719 [Suillus paluster]|uniref:uncharacterized protein n=1 Tax=Suillus paluster TaxID=48578 RepID=UPI001B87A363|nr:uncharacterized protein EDB91DRAFT_278719 [Suillus paluster]KAG1755187.1 hypothetical protein EDB91DRAFT_278719 [Suillus paluster]